MNADLFRALALALPGAVELSHHAHPDFRVRGKIFATLGPDATWGMVKLDPARQSMYCAAEPRAYVPVSGAWGRGGATRVVLEHASRASVARALRSAHELIVGHAHESTPRSAQEPSAQARGAAAGATSARPAQGGTTSAGRATTREEHAGKKKRKRAR